MLQPHRVQSPFPVVPNWYCRHEYFFLSHGSSSTPVLSLVLFDISIISLEFLFYLRLASSSHHLPSTTVSPHLISPCLILLKSDSRWPLCALRKLRNIDRTKPDWGFPLVFQFGVSLFLHCFVTKTVERPCPSRYGQSPSRTPSFPLWLAR